MLLKAIHIHYIIQLSHAIRKKNWKIGALSSILCEIFCIPFYFTLVSLDFGRLSCGRTCCSYAHSTHSWSNAMWPLISFQTKIFFLLFLNRVLHIFLLCWPMTSKIFCGLCHELITINTLGFSSFYAWLSPDILLSFGFLFVWKSSRFVIDKSSDRKAGLWMIYVGLLFFCCAGSLN